MDAETIAELHAWRKTIKGCTCVIEQYFSLEFNRVGDLCPHCTELNQMLSSLQEAMPPKKNQTYSEKATRRSRKNAQRS
jgi:phage FluMu protein Com